MKRSRNGTEFVVCVANRGYRVSLVVRPLYRLIPDRDALQRGLVRIVDESGEDYLYPKEYFRRIELPPEVAQLYSHAGDPGTSRPPSE